MIVRIMLILMLLSGQLAMAAGPKLAAPRPQSGADPTLRDFVGTNGIPTPETAQELGIGWVRSDIPWPILEPQKGHFNWGAADATVKKVEGMGLGFLPMVGYTPAWAAVDPKNAKSPPKDPQDWANFVEQLVARYSAAPYNLRYFQIWNEPTRAAGYFAGTPQQYIDQVYLPAARIIRRHNCYVVFGGWPVSNPLSQYEQILNYHNAWQWTDIVDVHYMPLPGWRQLCDEWVQSGKCRGIWQSEMGYTSDQSYVPHAYLFGLYVALSRGWTNPDQYKFFWFTLSSSGSDAPSCLLRSGALTAQGTRLKVLNDLLGGGDLSLLNGLTTRPSLPPNGASSTALGFRVGQNRAVVGVLLINDRSTQVVSIQVPVPRRPTSTQVVSPTGESRPIPGQYAGGRLTVNIPRSDLQVNGGGLIGYLRIDGI